METGVDQLSAVKKLFAPSIVFMEIISIGPLKNKIAAEKTRGIAIAARIVLIIKTTCRTNSKIPSCFLKKVKTVRSNKNTNAGSPARGWIKSVVKPKNQRAVKGNSRRKTRMPKKIMIRRKKLARPCGVVARKAVKGKRKIRSAAKLAPGVLLRSV